MCVSTHSIVVGFLAWLMYTSMTTVATGLIFEKTDFAQYFYEFHTESNASDDSVSVQTPSLVPARAAERLENLSLGIEYDDLPELLKRALLWDLGLVSVGDSLNQSEVVQVYTKCGNTMEDINVPTDDYLSTTCTEKNCTDTDIAPNYRSQNCNGSYLLEEVQCATEIVGNDAHSSMWATPLETAMEVSNTSYIYRPNMLRHPWWAGYTWIVYAIHSVSSDLEPAWNNCASSDQYSGPIIPCIGLPNLTSTELSSYCTPEPGSVTNAWLKEYAASIAPSSSGLSTGAIVGVIVGCVCFVLLLLGITFWCVCRKRRDSLSLLGDAPYQSNTLQTPIRRGSNPKFSSLGKSNTGSTGGSKTGTFSWTDSIGDIDIDDEFMGSKRVNYKEIEYKCVLSKGAFGEVWFGTWNGQKVAIKRLNPDKKENKKEIENFAKEIRLMAYLDHPKIVPLYGYGWNILQNLCAVTEFMEKGDLFTVIHEKKTKLSWSDHGYTIALDVIEALEYLHSLDPKIVHRDLKSKNVLLKEDLSAKLSDFGISRNRSSEETMTAGVGTAFWTAPEVFTGTNYDEKADIYSFGVLLSEIDTGKIPYSNIKGSNGERLTAMALISSIIQNDVRPEFSSSCPRFVRLTAQACLSKDPKKRPSASEVLLMLHRNNS